MVSLQTALSSKPRTAGSSGGPFAGSPPAAISPAVLADSSRKRKRDTRGACCGEGGEFLITAAGTRNGAAAKEASGGGSFLELLMCPNNSRRPTVADEQEPLRVPQQMLDVELHLGDRPMPAEWQRCLDIQSGRIHFLNTRTHTRASKDHRRSPPSPPKSIGFDAPAPAGIDLELNLSCDSSSSSSASSQRGEDLHVDQHNGKNENKITRTTNKAATATAGVPAVAAASPESSLDEMVAAVCARCHMLIMMRRTSPSCPNCKFLHPPPSEQQQQQGFGGRSLVRPAAGFSRLLCCND